MKKKKKRIIKADNGTRTPDAGVVKASNTGIGADSAPTPSTPKIGWSDIGDAADALTGLFPQPDAYNGKAGALQAGLDSAYSQASDIMMKINPVIGGVMKAGSFANKGLQALGIGTDGMTKTDAILGSDFLALTPFGLINSLGAKKADTMEADKETLSMGGNSYSGAADTVMDAADMSGAKFGLFSKKGRLAANDQMAYAGRLQNNMKTIMQNNNMMQQSIANQQDMNNQMYNNMMQGIDYTQMPMSAKRGGILTTNAYQIAHRVAFNHMKQQPVRFVDIPTAKEEPQIQLTNDFEPVMIYDNFVPDTSTDIDMFQKGGQMSILPEGALHRDRHHIEQEREDLKGEITHKGIPVISIPKDGQQPEQVAEIEHSEWILSADLTNSIESMRDEYNKTEDKEEKFKIAAEAGRLLAEEVMENTDDRVGLIKKIKV